MFAEYATALRRLSARSPGYSNGSHYKLSLLNCIDIGANLGDYSHALLTTTHAKILAFEKLCELKAIDDGGIRHVDPLLPKITFFPSRISFSSEKILRRHSRKRFVSGNSVDGGAHHAFCSRALLVPPPTPTAVTIASA